MAKTSEEPAQADWTWADPKNLEVNPEFQRLIPLQAKGELLAMEESIKQEGCRDPLLVWKEHNIVLDGHTRRELCKKHKKQVKVKEIELADEKAAIEFILKIQRQRRNLTREAMSYFRGSEYNALKKPRGGNTRGQGPKDQNGPMDSTAQQLADKYGVGQMTIKRDGIFAQVVDKIVADYDDPDVKRELLGADVKMTQGTAKVLLKMPKAERKKAIDELLEKGELPRAKRGKGPANQKPKDIAQSYVNRLKQKSEEHARAVLEQMARLLGLTVTDSSAGRKTAGK